MILESKYCYRRDFPFDAVIPNRSVDFADPDNTVSGLLFFLDIGRPCLISALVEIFGGTKNKNTDVLKLNRRIFPGRGERKPVDGGVGVLKRKSLA